MPTDTLVYAPYTAPFAHQAQAFEASKDAPVYALMMDPGTGKTWIALQTLGHWYCAHGLRSVLVVAPNGVHENWAHEIEKHLNPTVPRQVLVYVSGKADKAQRQLDQWNTEGRDALQLVLMNVEALSTPKGADFAYRWMRRQGAFGTVGLVVDESHRVKAPRARRTKAVLRLCGLAQLRRIMSGSAWAHGLEDLYAQYRVLDPAILGHSTFTSFKGEFCLEQRFARFTKVVGYRNIDTLKQRMAPVTAYARLEECVDLPPVQGGMLGAEPLIVRVEMLPEQARIYRDLSRRFLTELETGATVTADEATTRLLRLQQVTGGGVRDDNNDFHTFPTAKTQPTLDRIEDAPRDTKVLVWCRFRHESSALTAALNDAGISALEHSGSVSTEERAVLRQRWQRDPAIRVLVATLSTGGTGFTLNEATLSLFFSNWYSYDDRVQAERRNLRIGQHRPVVYYDIVCRGTVDEYILRVLRRRQSLDAMFRTAPTATLHQLLTEGAS